MADFKLSNTRINTFLQCKLKYKYNYIDHLPKVANPAFKLGTACHEALEFAGLLWKKNNQSFSKEDMVAILNKYNEVSVTEGILDTVVHKTGYDLIEKKIKSFGGKETILELELPFGMNGGVEVVTKDGVPLIGAIDKVAEYDQDTLIISDYKTQNTAPTPEYVKTDVQLSIYDLVASKLYPSYKRIILCLDLLKFEPIYSYRTVEERILFEDYLKAVYNIMLAFNPAVDAKASLNIFCSWCDYKDYCPAYIEACKKSDYKFLSLNKSSDAELLEEWNTLRSTKALIEGRKRDLDFVIMTKIKDGGVNLNSTDEEIYVKQSSRVAYDVKTVFDSMPVEDFVGVVTISKKALTDYMNKNVKMKRVIEEGSIVNYTAPFLDTRKLKKDKKIK